MRHVALGPVAHFSLAVLDPVGSAAWWTKHFDLAEITRNDARVLLGNDNIVISLAEGHPDPSVLKHLAFRALNRAELEEARDLLLEGGVELEDPGDEIGPVAPGSKSIGLWFRDLDGYRWELFVSG